MPDKNPDLNDNAPDESGVALVVIDMINDLEFPGADAIFEPALAAAHRIAELKARAKAGAIPVIYANDNFGRWRSDFKEVVSHCLTGGVRGEPLARLLEPEPEDYFVLKPKHSAFLATTMEMLLAHLGCRRLILTGIAGNMCVQITAADAHMRDFHLNVPGDCVASNTPQQHQRSQLYLKEVLGVNTTGSAELDLDKLQHT